MFLKTEKYVFKHFREIFILEYQKIGIFGSVSVYPKQKFDFLYKLPNPSRKPRKNCQLFFVSEVKKIIRLFLFLFQP